MDTEKPKLQSSLDNFVTVVILIVFYLYLFSFAILRRGHNRFLGSKDETWLQFKCLCLLYKCSSVDDVSIVKLSELVGKSCSCFRLLNAASFNSFGHFSPFLHKTPSVSHFNSTIVHAAYGALCMSCIFFLRNAVAQ